ncbi:MAG: DNA-binding protein [Phycisphaerae bacterium]|nr:DNA-binding protein [Phycisphaerae bacterium]MDG1899606.1 HU family DNA-binding protein [Phycisphaerales bacterium]|tara:strand:- start:319 stop:666 length:348 start_codon:yes stop_codon:yes gene_type:complete
MAKKKTKKKTKKTTEVKPLTKSQIFGTISDDTGLTRKEVASVFDSMNGLVKKEIGRRGPGMFTVPGLMKIVKTHKPRRAARKGINPFTGEEMMFKAKPAHNVVKVRPLKGLKEMV